MSIIDDEMIDNVNQEVINSDEEDIISIHSEEEEEELEPEPIPELKIKKKKKIKKKRKKKKKKLKEFVFENYEKY